MHRGIRRAIKRTFISVFALIILFTLAGVVYVRISEGTPVKTQPVPAADPDEPKPLPAPKPPNPNAAEGVAIESLLSPVAPGANTSVSIRTLPTSKCVIEVTYNNVAAKDSGLVPKIADPYGGITWSWTVDKTAPVGTWPVKVTCTFNGRGGVVIGNLVVAQ